MTGGKKTYKILSTILCTLKQNILLFNMCLFCIYVFNLFLPCKICLDGNVPGLTVKYSILFYSVTFLIVLLILFFFANLRVIDHKKCVQVLCIFFLEIRCFTAETLERFFDVRQTFCSSWFSVLYHQHSTSQTLPYDVSLHFKMLYSASSHLDFTRK